MKFTKLIPSFILLMLLSFALHAQNGNAVISEVQHWDNQDGTATLLVRVSGNLTNSFASGTFTASPSGTSGITAIHSLTSVNELSSGPGNSASFYIGVFPYNPSPFPGDDFYDFDINIPGVAAAIVLGNKTKKEANYKHISR